MSPPCLTLSKNKTGREGVNIQSVLRTCMHPPGRAAECGKEKETERRRRLAYSFIADSDKQWQKVIKYEFPDFDFGYASFQYLCTLFCHCSSSAGQLNSN